MTYGAAEINQFYDRDGIPLWRELARSPDGRDSRMMTFGYWQEGTSDLWTAQHKLLALVRNAVDAKPESAGIDVACGRGALLMHFAESLNCSMLGVNISNSQLDDCAQAVREAGLHERVELKLADAMAFRAAPESADFITCTEAACHFAEKGRFLGGCMTCLRPGGRLVLTDITAERTDELIFSDFIRPVSASRWRELLQNAGFVVERLDGVGAQVFEPLFNFFKRRWSGVADERKRTARIWKFILQNYERQSRVGNLDYHLIAAKKPA